MGFGKGVFVDCEFLFTSVTRSDVKVLPLEDLRPTQSVRNLKNLEEIGFSTKQEQVKGFGESFHINLRGFFRGFAC